jgi:hypothetical protein
VVVGRMSSGVRAEEDGGRGRTRRDEGQGSAMNQTGREERQTHCYHYYASSFLPSVVCEKREIEREMRTRWGCYSGR